MQISDTEYGSNLMSTKEQNPQNNNPQHPFLTKWLEQINIALEQKGSGNFSAAGRDLPSETNVRKEHMHQLKSGENEHPAFFPLEQDDIVNSLNYEGIAVIELQFYHFPDVTDCVCWLCHRLNSLND